MKWQKKDPKGVSNMNYSTKTKMSVIFLITIFMVTVILVSCSKNSVFVNKKYAKSGMLTINKSAFNYKKGIISDNAGLGLHLTPNMQKLKEKESLSVVGLEDYGLNVRE